MQISADHTDTLEEARSGQIVAIHGLTGVRTGDTLVTPKVVSRVFYDAGRSFLLA